MTPEDRFDDLVTQLVETPGVTPLTTGSAFGSGTLRVRGKIFAMLTRGGLVVKLPKARVDELVATGEGVRFDANKGKPMKEWFSLDPQSRLAWLPLAQEALAFVDTR
jgi:TfoX/Sxy family transcriptional regulator of competence genes